MQRLRHLPLRSNKISRIFGIFGLIILHLVVGQLASAQGRNICASDAELDFVCGLDHPEDLARLPHSNWLIASGFAPGAGLKLIDMRRRTGAVWFHATPDQIRPDPGQYSDCAAPPAPDIFNARGLHLRRLSRGHARLFVVNHGGRESIEVFDITYGGAVRPQLSWTGCLLMPPSHVGNAVSTYRDGTVLVTVLTRPGASITDFERGYATGGVFERAPKASEFHLIPGTELPGNNGLEVARDDSGFYTIAFGWRAVAMFHRNATGGPYAVIPTPDFMPDNIHWDGGRLIAAGMISDEPACGGKRQIIDGVADKMLCHRGWRVAELNVSRYQWHILGEGQRNASFNGVSSAVLYGSSLWMGSYQADRVAIYRARSASAGRRSGALPTP
jgi:hypothetical protein